ncbi:MAG: hypothetical protein ACK4VO_10735 [Pseudobdellovibrio sp.]
MNTELSAEIRFRCPHCQKLFCTDKTAFDSDQKADFQCTECRQDFILHKKTDNTGLFLTSVAIEKKFSNCPKCSFLKPIQSDECPNCGVLESKYIEIQKAENPRLFELNKAWQFVLSDITQDQLHQNFLDLAQKQSALNFAAQKYSDLKKVLGHDEIVEKYLKQIEQRLSFHIQSQFNQAKAEQTDNEVIEGFKRHYFIIVGLVGTTLLILNRIYPLYPNLNGLVVAITVLSYGLYFTTKNSKNDKI